MFNGKKVRELRKKKGLTMSDFGNKIGISEAYVSMLETGKRECPDGKVLWLISKELNCSPSDLTDSKIMLAFAESFAQHEKEAPRRPCSIIIPPENPMIHQRIREEMNGLVEDLKSENEALRKRVEMLEEAFKLLPKSRG